MICGHWKITNLDNSNNKNLMDNKNKVRATNLVEDKY
jgi:hypothetical protein